MALNSGLFEGQDRNEQDLLQSPGWTIDEQHAGFFDNAALALPRGIGQAGANIMGTLAQGFQDIDDSMSMDLLVPKEQKPAPSPTLQSVQDSTREFSKTLTPDPRVTGGAANLVQGFSKAVTEFTAGTLAGGPGLGASLLGASEGNARYHDLLDEGVDDATARKGGTIEALASGGGALLPMGLPAKWLGGSLSTVGTMLAQAGTGAAINTTFGIASRYASSKILEDAGYHEMADQQKPFDEMNLAADAISGLFFGAHHGWGEINQSHVDPSVRDAAKVVQDRQAVAERAPGVPVDMRSAAVNRQELESSMGDLLAGKKVEIAADDVEGATFARTENPLNDEARQIIADHFKESGVFEAADAHDAWLRGEGDEMEPTTPATLIDGRPAEEQSETQATPEAETKGEEEPQEPGPLVDRPDLKIADENGEPVHAGDAQEQASAESAQANREADTMFKAATDCEARRGA